MEKSSEIPADALVSVIIPAYNASRYIKETLDSVFAQSYLNYEVIVVNDGSPDTDALEKALEPYRQRLTYLKQQNTGPSGARNHGMRAATGQLIACLDSDDLWEPSYLAVQTQFLREHPEYDLVYCNARFFGDSVYDGKEYMQVCPSEGEATSAAILARRCHVFTSITARRDILLSVGFDESIRASEDFDCWLRFTAAGHRIGYHRTVLVHYRKHQTSASANFIVMAECNIRVLTKCLSLWPDGSEEARLLRQTRQQKVAELETFYGKRALTQGDISDSVAHLQSANQLYQSRKISAVILILKVAPSLVGTLYKLRRLLVRAHRDL